MALHLINKTVASPSRRPLRVLQFGEGNFLRGFVDWMIDIANETGLSDAGVAVAKVIKPGSLASLHAQGGQYTVLLRGGSPQQPVVQRRVVSCLQQLVDCYEDYPAFLQLAALPELQVVVSNTTEAGIVFRPEDRLDDKPAESYPGKLTQFLWARYQALEAAPGSGLVLLPVELIEHNGTRLYECVCRMAAHWGLPKDFLHWVETENHFCNTLVDRIVTGYSPSEADDLWEEWGYRDECFVTGEPFALWAIECDDPQVIESRLPLRAAGLPVVYTPQLQAYRERKVRLLNGGHTGMVAAGLLAGIETVGGCMQDEALSGFLRRMMDEDILPTLQLPQEETAAYAQEVRRRFENLFLEHRLLSIALNSVSKWKTRLLPSLLDRLAQTGRCPARIVFSFSALLALYRQAALGRFPVEDDAEVKAFFAAQAEATAEQLARCAAQNTAFWGQDLQQLPGFSEQAVYWLSRLEEDGLPAALREAGEA